MSFIKRTDFHFKKTEFGDLPQIFSITREANHSNWTESDYRDEIVKPDIFAVSATIEQAVIGFLIARLIISEIESAECIRGFNSIKTKVTNPKRASANVVFSSADVENCLTVDCICRCPVEIDIEIYNIAVSASFQKQGVGAALLDNLYKNTKQSFEFRRINVWLEVRNSNRRALDFYLSQGFERISERKNYYTCPNENAQVLKREIARDEIR